MKKIRFLIFLICMAASLSTFAATDHPLFKEKNVSFTASHAATRLQGTLTMPLSFNGTTKIVIMVAPPEYANKDYHRKFSALAHDLSKAGIASFRYDNRHFTDSINNPKGSCTIDCLANDIHNAYLCLRQQSRLMKNPIGIMSYTDGIFPALIEASRNKQLAFLVTLSGCMIDGNDYLYQRYSTYENYYCKGTNEELNLKNIYLYHIYDILETLKNEKDSLACREHIFDQIEQDKKQLGTRTDKLLNLYNNWSRPYGKSIIRFTVAPYLSVIKCRVLAVWGFCDEMLDRRRNVENFEKKCIDANKGNYCIKITPTNHYLDKHIHKYEWMPELETPVSDDCLQNDVSRAVSYWLINNNVNMR